MRTPSGLPSGLTKLAVVGLMLLAIGLASWPWISSSDHRPNQTTYLGTHTVDVLDTQVYVSSIQANADGHSLTTNLFTAETQSPSLFSPLWWALGRVQAWTGWQSVTVFWVAKAVLGGWLVVLIYQLLGHFFTQARWRLLGLLLAVFGGGVGGFFLLGLTARPGLVWAYQDTRITEILPTDVLYSSGYIWSAIGHSPLYVAALLALLGAAWATWRSFVRPQWMMLAGVLVFLLGLIHPYDLFIIFSGCISVFCLGVVGNLLTPVMAQRLLRRIGVLALCAAPAALYYAWMLWRVPAIGEWNHQNVLPTTNLRNLVAGYAPLLILAVVGARAWHRTRPHALWIPLAWLVSAFVLLYSPLMQYQAKMVIGLSVSLGILATAGVQTLFQTSGRHLFFWRIGALILVVISISTPGIFFMRWQSAQLHEPRYFYASNDVLDALHWIRTNTPPSSIVLGDVWTGNLVPHYAGRATYLGHHHQTSNYPKKLKEVRDWFFESADEPAEKTTWLRQTGIDYLVFGPYERQQGSFDPAQLTALVPVFSRGAVTVYAVQP